jgi:hypothetical protein
MADIVRFDNTDYRVDGFNIVNDTTNMVVSNSLAMMIAEATGLQLPKTPVETGGRLDTGYLNSLIKTRTNKG